MYTGKVFNRKRLRNRLVISCAIVFLFACEVVISQPLAPQGFYVISETGSNELFWNQNSPAVVSYIVYRSSDSVTFTDIAVVLDNASPFYEDTDIDNDTSYYYYVTAFDGALESLPSEVDVGISVVHFGNFVDFETGTGKITLSDSDELSFENPDPFSISFWLYVDQLPLPGNESNLVSRFESGSDINYFINLTGGGEIEFGNSNNVTSQLLTSPVIVPDQWHHIAMVHTAPALGNLELFIDGVSEGNIPVLVLNTNGGWLEIGNEFDGINSLDAKMDELSIWSKSLSLIEVQNLAGTQLRGDETDLVGLWHFNIDDGNVYDYSIHGNNGVITGGETIASFRPKANEDLLNMDEDGGVVVVDVQDNDDTNGASTLVTTLLEVPQFGQATIINQDSISYEPDPEYSGPDTIVYVINSYENQKQTYPDSLFHVGTLIINVDEVNDAPTIEDETNVSQDTLFYTATEDELSSFDFNVSDKENHAISVISILSENSSPTVGAINVTSGVVGFDYTTALNFDETDTLEVIVQDNGAPSEQDNAILVIEIDPVNDPPEITDELLVPSEILYESVVEDGSVIIPVNTIDIEGDDVEIVSVQSIVNSRIIAADGFSFTYTPESDFSGYDSLLIVVTDDGSPPLQDEAIMVIEVGAVNDAPQITNQSFVPVERVVESIYEDEPTLIGIYTIDPDGNDVEILSIQSFVSDELLSLEDTDGSSFVYTPDPNYSGFDSLKVIVTDNGVPPLQDTATLVIQINPVNDAPVITDSAYIATDTIYASTLEDESLFMDIFSTDIEGDDVQLVGVQSIVSTNAMFGYDNAYPSSFTYIPEQNFNGSDTLQVVVEDDGSPNMQTSAILVMQVDPVNDAPLVLNQYDEPSDTLVFSVDETQICINAIDIENDDVSISNELFESYITQVNGLCIDLDSENQLRETQYFEVQVCDDGEPVLCTDVTVAIEVIQLIPQGISPNGDGIGDEWTIPTIADYQNNQVSIYDRWGTLVYQKTGYNNNDIIWRGQSNMGLRVGSNVLPDGAYYYIINYGSGKSSDKGFVMIRR